MKISTLSLRQSILIGIVIFNFWIPYIFLNPLWEFVRFGFVTTGGVSKNCTSVDFDPRAGGNNCDGEDYLAEPVSFLTLPEALGSVFKQYKNAFTITLILGVIVGLGYYTSENHKQTPATPSK